MVKMKEFDDFINERLNQEAWLKLKEDTAMSFNDTQYNVDDVIKSVVNLMNAKVEDLVFTANDVGGKEDFTYFKSHIINHSKKMSEETARGTDYTLYLTHYMYEDSKSFVMVEVKDTYEYSFIVINKNDFEFYNEATKPNFV